MGDQNFEERRGLEKEYILGVEITCEMTGIAFFPWEFQVVGWLKVEYKGVKLRCRVKIGDYPDSEEQTAMAFPTCQGATSNCWKSDSEKAK